MKFEIIKSELVETKETHVYTLEKQQVSVIRIEGEPLEAIIRPGHLNKEGVFIYDTLQEGLSVNVGDDRFKALIKVMKVVYGDI